MKTIGPIRSTLFGLLAVTLLATAAPALAKEKRVPIEKFRAYAHRRFDAGTGWTYHVSQRHVFLDGDHNTAWFDEALHNDKYGECRGTGVLVKIDGGWKIAQYNLTIPIPNAIALDVVKMIRQAGDSP